MIKAKIITTDGEQIVLLGISAENMVRLMADEPIDFNFTEVGLPSQRVILIGGRDEESIERHLRSFIKPGEAR